MDKIVKVQRPNRSFPKCAVYLRMCAEYELHIIFECVNNRDAKIKYKGMKLLELQITLNWKMENIKVQYL